MIKKLAFSGLLAATLLGASDFNYQVTPVAGYLWNSTSNEKNLNNGGATGGVQNHAVYGLEAQLNNLSGIIKPELSFLYGRDRVTGAGNKTNVLSTMINGVYELDNSTVFTPFAKAGVGYEWYTNNFPNDYNGLILDAGLGTKVALTKHIALKLEGLYMYKMNKANSVDGSNGEIHNVAALAGLAFSFGGKEAPAVIAEQPKPEPKPVVEAPKPVPAPVIVPPAPAPKPAVVAAPVDSDKDGVFDPADKCPNTPAGFKVDVDGCPLKTTLHLHFATDSNKVDAEGTAKVNEFAAFLKESPAYKATIVGHTDSIASDKYNQKLSEKRANKVKSMLVEQGVAEDRLTASGEGEKMPVASNKTKEGRAENRRIEVELCK